MTRLIVKELRMNRIYLIVTVLGTALVLLLGDPLGFRGPTEAGRWALLLALPFLLMGLAAYSRELGDETLSFLMSRPVRWWWVYLSKFLAGLIVCAGAGVAAVVIYLIVVPSEYRSLMTITSLVGGAASLAFLYFGLAFAMGFLASVAPTAMLSFLVLFASFGMIVYLTEGLTDIGWYPLLAIPLTAAVFALFRGKSPRVLESPVLMGALMGSKAMVEYLRAGSRFVRWLGILIIGCAVMLFAELVLSWIIGGDMQGLLAHSGWYLMIPVLLAAVIAGLACAKPPIVLNAASRFGQWLGIMILGCSVMVIAGLVLSWAWVGPPNNLTQYPSPDRQMMALSAKWSWQPGPHSLWVCLSDGHYRKLNSPGRLERIIWSLDSRTLYFVSIRDGQMEMSAASERTRWKPVSVCAPLALNLYGGDARVETYGPTAVGTQWPWSPSGKRLLIQWKSLPNRPLSATSQASESCATVVDVSARKAWLLPDTAATSAWWIDDEHLASDAGVIAVSPQTTRGIP